MTTSLFLLVMLFLTLASGFFSASETALFSISSMKIKTYQTNKNPRNRLIASLVLHPKELLVTVFMLNTLVNILLQNTASSLFGNLAGWSLKVGIPLILTLIFGEIIPKYVGIVNNTTIAYAVAPTIAFLQKIITPVRKGIIAITTPLSRIMFFFLKKETTISEDEIHHLLLTSKDQGVLHPDEAELINGYLTLQNSQIKELMRPREEMLFYDINEPLTKLTYLLVDQECTRVPTCDKNIENLLGIISADRFFLNRDKINHPQDLLTFLDKPFFFPETIPARILLRRFDEQNEEMAIVVDEYGAISGLITYEDLIEIVVGEIADRRDQHQLYTLAGKDVIIASGKLEIADFEEIFGVKLLNPANMVTLSGWLIEQIGDIPKSGMKYEAQNFLFQILGAKPNRITRIYIRKLVNKS